MLYETDMDIYEKLKKCLFELDPDIMVKLISSDSMLKKLGFVDKIPCVVEVCADDRKIQRIRDIALDYEILVCGKDEYFDKNDVDYRNYLRYGWLYDFL